MPADPRRVKELFVAALDLPDDAARRAWLDRECGDDPEFRRRLDALLAAHDEPISALERPLAVEMATRSFVPGDVTGGRPDPWAHTPAARVGRYKLLELIGEGGMGQVWVAEQLEPIRRRVALKLIKPGMDSRAILARFEAERQALALMDHPNIARVLDAGTTEDGRPYFAMELIKGVPVTEFCDARRLTTRERLELFEPICRAIQHAHRKGIIHRDIKPSNVLVALHDEQPIPKVIDFGVAKAVGRQLTEGTLYTGFGSLVGTPAYMAPEQAAFNQLDVDTRTDVYALGALLYELLTGSPPFEPERLKRAAIDEVLRVVREEEPPRPSARLSTSGSRASLAAVRRSDPDKLPGLLRGELDWIVMKALEKDRNRRYDDAAAGLAADVRRYLDGEPVQAHPPGTVYRLRKFTRRHRLALGTATAFVGLLIVSAVVSAWLAVRARESAASAARQWVRAEDNARRLAGALAATERNAAGLRVDLELTRLEEGDSRLGLLRLAHDLRTIPADAQDLREFVTAAVLAGGQEVAPLLPPIALDGQEVIGFLLAPDRRKALTLGPDGAVRLWEVRTARPIALLRQGAERVVACNFSPDGRTVVTDDQTSVARFWDAADGRFRAATEARANRHESAEPLPRSWKQRMAEGSTSWSRPPHVLLGVGDRCFLTSREKEAAGSPPRTETVGPVELWDTATGRLVARLDDPRRSAHGFRLEGDGRWVVADDGMRTVLVFSTEDGRLVGRLEHPEGKLSKVLVDTTGRRIATVVDVADRQVVRIWDSDREWVDPAVVPLPRKYLAGGVNTTEWWAGRTIGSSVFTVLIDAAPRNVLRLGPPVDSFGVGSNAFSPLRPDGDLIQLDGGGVFETQTWQRLFPPPGRRFHPALARFAGDGRFVPSHLAHSPFLPGIIDVRTERQFPTGRGVLRDDARPSGLYERLGVLYGPVKGFGLVTCTDLHAYAVGLRILPTTDLGTIPDDLLEDWLRLAFRGEIGPDGAFVPWDEPTWDRRRQALATRPVAPPLPGHLANDPLHWLRREYTEAPYGPGRDRLAAELLRRAEALGDRAEAARWREEMAAIAARPAPKPSENP